MDEFNIPISMIRQFVFCRRIPFYYLARGLKPAEQPWVKQGCDFHKKTEMLQKRRNLSRFGLNEEFKLFSEKSLYSEDLGIHGICDGYLVTQNEVIPLEFKLQDNMSFGKGAELQLCAYGMILQESLGRNIKKGFVLYGEKGKTFKVDFSQEKINEVITIVSHIKNDRNKGLIPSSTATAKQCSQCEFSNFCADRL